MKPSLEVKLGPLSLRNPVVMASGTFGYGLDYPGIVEPQQVGAVFVKGLSLEPWQGHAPPRLVETPAGLVNAIGLENPGVDHFIEHLLPPLAGTGATILANVVGRRVEEYAEVAARLDRTGLIAGFELNVSCPNIKEGGAAFSSSPVSAARVVHAVRARTKLPLFVKIAPMAADPVAVARACAMAGADGLTVANTYPAMVIDTVHRRSALTSGAGGLSGPAVRPLSVRLAAALYEATGLPIIGSGGVETARDALEYMMAGARAVAVGTATFHRPTAALEVIDGLRAYLEAHGHASLDPVVGAAAGPPGHVLPAQEAAVQLLDASGAAMSGHFRLSSGNHSDRYVEKFRLLERPALAAEAARLLALRCLDLDVEVVAAPATGGILLGYELARQLGVERAIFAERTEGGLRFRRGFAIRPGERVLVAEDVVTTGGSLLEAVDAVRGAGGRIAGACCLIDRSGGRFALPDASVPYRPLVQLSLETWPPDACPLCLQGLPLADPGSRRLHEGTEVS